MLCQSLKLGGLIYSQILKVGGGCIPATYPTSNVFVPALTQSPCYKASNENLKRIRLFHIRKFFQSESALLHITVHHFVLYFSLHFASAGKRMWFKYFKSSSSTPCPPPPTTHTKYSSFFSHSESLLHNFLLLNYNSSNTLLTMATKTKIIQQYPISIEYQPFVLNM